MDLGFILHDLYNLINDSPCNRGQNLASLGLDLAGAVLPGVTGLGTAARAAKGENVISTGRTVPNDLREKLAMEEVMSNPKGTTPPRMPPMSDTKNGLLAEDGWVKRAQNVNGVEIHYVENVNTGVTTDFKFK